MKLSTKRFHFSLIIIFSVYLSTGCVSKNIPENHVQTILSKIISAKNSISSHLQKKGVAGDSIHFVTFWDFDGTILKGDCTEGLYSGKSVIYRGLAELAIREGLSPLYKKNSFDMYLKEYMRLMNEKGHYEAYIFIPRAFTGAQFKKLVNLSRRHFETVLNKYYFTSSMNIINGLKKSGTEILVISASPDFFVRGSASTTGLAPGNLSGIALQVKNGIIGRKIVKPVNYGPGKTEKLKQILKALKKFHGSEHVYVLGAFGNSYHTDGHFLAWTASQVLPGGNKPVAVMINGGSPPSGYAAELMTVIQKQTVQKL